MPFAGTQGTEPLVQPLLPPDFSRPLMALLLTTALCACGHDPRVHVAAVPPPPPAYQVVIPVPPPAPKPVPAVAPQALVASITSLGKTFAGRVGIAVRSIDQGW